MCYFLTVSICLKLQNKLEMPVVNSVNQLQEPYISIYITISKLILIFGSLEDAGGMWDVVNTLKEQKVTLIFVISNNTVNPIYYH